MIEAPFALEAAGSLGHAPRSNQQSENLPVRSVQVLDVRKAGQAQAGGKCAQRKENGAHERFLPQAKDREEEMHNPSMYRGGAAEAICRIQGSQRGRRGVRDLASGAKAHDRFAEGHVPANARTL